MTRSRSVPDAPRARTRRWILVNLHRRSAAAVTQSSDVIDVPDTRAVDSAMYTSQKHHTFMLRNKDARTLGQDHTTPREKSR